MFFKNKKEYRLNISKRVGKKVVFSQQIEAKDYDLALDTAIKIAKSKGLSNLLEYEISVKEI